jgi:hypothetical protein
VSPSTCPIHYQSYILTTTSPCMSNLNIFALLLHLNFFTLELILFVNRNTSERPSKVLMVQHFIFTSCPQIQGRYTSYRPLKQITIFYHFISRWNIFPIGNHLDRPCSSKSTALPELTVAADCCFAQLTASLTKHHVHCYGKHHRVQIAHNSFNSRRDMQNSYLLS